MPIKQIGMLLLLSVFCFKAFSQQVDDGLYVLSTPTSLNKIGNISYINISKNKFLLFSLERNPAQGSQNFGVNLIGNGDYSIDNKYFTLHFSNDSTSITSTLINDSIACSFSTDTSNKNVVISLTLYNDKQTPGEATLSIETPQKIYRFETKNDSVTAEIPFMLKIMSVKLTLVTYGERTLPYDYHFNKLQYNYYLKDPQVILNYVHDTDLQLKIKSKNSDGYWFESHASLLKAGKDVISFLRKNATSDKTLQNILDFIGQGNLP